MPEDDEREEEEDEPDTFWQDRIDYENDCRTLF